MKLLNYVLGLLFSIALTATVALYCVNHFIDADYFYGTAQKSGLDNATGELISQRLIDINQINSGVSGDAINKTLSSSVAEQYINDKNHAITNQLESLLRGKQDKIEVDFSDLSKISQSAGLNVTSVDVAPLEITPPKSILSKSSYYLQRIEFLLFVSGVLTVGLGAAMIFFAFKLKSATPIVVSLATSAVLIAAIALAALLASSWANKLVLSLPETLATLRAPVENFGKDILSDIKGWLLLASVIILTGATLTAFGQLMFRRNSRKIIK